MSRRLGKLNIRSTRNALKVLLLS